MVNPGAGRRAGIGSFDGRTCNGKTGFFEGLSTVYARSKAPLPALGLSSALDIGACTAEATSRVRLGFSAIAWGVRVSSQSRSRMHSPTEVTGGPFIARAGIALIFSF